MKTRNLKFALMPWSYIFKTHLFLTRVVSMNIIYYIFTRYITQWRNELHRHYGLITINLRRTWIVFGDVNMHGKGIVGILCFMDVFLLFLIIELKEMISFVLPGNLG